MFYFFICLFACFFFLFVLDFANCHLRVKRFAGFVILILSGFLYNCTESGRRLEMMLSSTNPNSMVQRSRSAIMICNECSKRDDAFANESTVVAIAHLVNHASTQHETRLLLPSYHSVGTVFVLLREKEGAMWGTTRVEAAQMTDVLTLKEEAFLTGL